MRYGGRRRRSSWGDAFDDPAGEARLRPASQGPARGGRAALTGALPCCRTSLSSLSPSPSLSPSLSLLQLCAWRLAAAGCARPIPAPPVGAPGQCGGSQTPPGGAFRSATGRARPGSRQTQLLSLLSQCARCCRGEVGFSVHTPPRPRDHNTASAFCLPLRATFALLHGVPSNPCAGQGGWLIPAPTAPAGLPPPPLPP